MMKDEMNQCKKCEKTYPASFIHNLTYLDSRTQEHTSTFVYQKCIANFPHDYVVLDVEDKKFLWMRK